MSEIPGITGRYQYYQNQANLLRRHFDKVPLNELKPEDCADYVSRVFVEYNENGPKLSLEELAIVASYVFPDESEA